MASPFTPRATKTIKIDPEHPDLSALEDAALAAREGEPVVFPTDTVYGIGVNALIPDADLEIFRIKERPADKPLILLVADPDDIERYVLDISDGARKLIAAYWPGPLTLIFKKAPDVPDEVTAGGATVGVRCPNNIIARELIRRARVAFATTSANISSNASPRTADEAGELSGRVAYIIDGGETKLGVESTVVDLSQGEPKIVRQGYLSLGEIIAAVNS
ncbi:MAG TPA: L-threonylcarbamoyladenylate synthase [Candidatus Aquicultor sp.]|jgi:L-threonylcarbamoyladenylate synthase